MSDYTQCQLERPSENGVEVRMTWIPTALAQVGKVLEFSRRKDGRLVEPDRGFVVVKVFASASWQDVDRMVDEREPFARVLGHDTTEWDRMRSALWDCFGSV